MKQTWIEDEHIELSGDTTLHISHDPNIECLDLILRDGGIEVEFAVDTAEACHKLADAFYRAALWLETDDGKTFSNITLDGRQFRVYLGPFGQS
jgi:hypothetical protein